MGETTNVWGRNGRNLPVRFLLSPEWGHTAGLLVVRGASVWLQARTSWEQLYKSEYTSCWTYAHDGMSICKNKLNGTSYDIKKQLKIDQKPKYKSWNYENQNKMVLSL